MSKATGDLALGNMRHPPPAATAGAISAPARISYYLLIPVGTLVVWSLTVYFQLSPEYLLPSPRRVFFHTLPQEFAKGRIFLDAAESVRRVVLVR